MAKKILILVILIFGIGFAFLNIRVNHDATTQLQNEQQIVVNPLDSLNVVAVWRDFRLGYRQVGVGYSTDGGLTWRDTLFRETSYVWQSDPGLTVDANGNFYAVILSFNSTSEPNGLFVLKSTNGGRDWGAPVAVVNRVPGVFEDKELIACDRTQSPYRGNLYVVWTRFYSTQIMLSRSTDGNQSWSSPIAISDGSASVQWPVPAVGPNGEVYCAWVRLSSPRSIRIDKSMDGGVTWGTDRTVQDVGFGQGYIQPSVLVFSYPAMDIDITDGPHRGNIYIAYMDYGPTTSETDLYFTKSTDGGASWSPRIRLNDDSLGNRRDQFHPWLKVDRDGVISVIWYDRRLDPNNMLMDVYLTQSTDGGNTWSPNVRVTTVSSDPRLFPPPAEKWSGGQPRVLAGRLGEYNGLDAWNREMIFAIWSDTRTGNPDTYVGIKDTASAIRARDNVKVREGLIKPNPTKSFLVVSASVGSEIKIYDFTGQLVAAQYINHPGNTGAKISLPDIKPGVYFLEINGEKEKRRKFIRR